MTTESSVTVFSLSHQRRSLSSLLRTVLHAAYRYLPLIIFAIGVGAPFIYMMTGSVRPQSELFEAPISFVPDEYTLSNYDRLLSGEQIPFLRQVFNSVLVASGQTALGLFVSGMVGWGFAMYKFTGQKVLFGIMLATLAIPFQVTLVPLFQLIERYGLLDSYIAVILPGSLTAFGAFFMRQAMLSVPKDIIEAGRIDGLSEWGLFWRMGLPLTRGASSVLGVLIYLAAWNDFLWPLIVLRTPEKFTFAIGLPALLSTTSSDYGALLAGSFLVTFPVILLFILGRKQLLENFTLGAVKG